MSNHIMPTLQKKRIIEHITSGKRFDGRKMDEFRDIVVEKAISKNAESAISLKLGKTHVYAGVKMAVTTPYPDSQDEGTFMTTAELHPMASSRFDIGRPGIEAIELARVIDRGIRESGFIDFKKLCIKEGEKVYQVFLDIIAINDDGNLFDAAGIAALIALGQARLPVYNEETEKIEHEFSKNPLPLNKEALSFNTTFHKIGNQIVIDPSVEEQAVSDFRLGIAIGEGNKKCRITAMQKGKEGAIDTEDMEKILNLTEEVYSKKYAEIKKLVFD
ncbi:RNA-binding protein [Candidatus Pacearchaeota archaeon]|nr:RNA-binding protein [Candidatus Pacearchaeota archaeon]|tara:strand:- start:2931 stop:3752 length:822 start_codon:yes stop_codon:yes gene_type:complete